MTMESSKKVVAAIWRKCVKPTLILTAVMLALMPFTAVAQTGQGSINGLVTDPRDAIVRGATVVVTSAETGVHNATTSNGAGIYNVLSLNPGTYLVEVSSKGFEKSLVENIIVGAAQTVTTNVQLKVGRENATVTVTAQDSLLTKDVSDVSTTVDHEIVENLPYPERSSLEAVLLIPGVNGDPLQPGGIATENPGAFTAYVTPGASIQVGGAPPGATSILVDGSDVTQGSYPRAGVNLSGRDVQETTAVTAGLSAMYGRTGAGIIIQASRAGTSQYHGGITWRHTDPYFNAFPLGGTIRSAAHENFYGFYVGGPVWLPKLHTKDKTFFFVGVEPARLSNKFGARATLFTPDELAGHFNNSLAVINQTLLKNQGYAYAITQPHPNGFGAFYHSTVDANGFPNGPVFASSGSYTNITGPVADCGVGFVGTVCPNDLAPQLAKNPLARYVLSQMPTPSNPGPNVVFDHPDASYQSDGTNASYTRGVFNIDNRYNIRIDHQFNNSNQIFARYTVIPVSALRYFLLAVDNPLNLVPTDAAHTHNIAFGYTHVFTNNLINNFRYSFLRVKQERLAPPSSLSQDYAAKYGLTPAGFGKGFPSLGNFNSNGIGYTLQVGISNSAINVDQNFIVGDDLVWNHGRHSVKFGGDVRWIQSNQYDLSGLTGGKYSFASGDTNNGSVGGISLATFILGTISGFSNTPLEVNGYYRWHYYSGYIQDDWRVTPKLTINAGLRYELETPRMEKFNNQGFVSTATSGTLNGLTTSSAFCFSGACGSPRTLWPINPWGFEPRIGISFASSPRTTMRASYSMSRLPLTGQENVPDPNFNVSGTAVNTSNGGTTAGRITNYITNPVQSGLTSAYTALNGRGPFTFSTGLAPVFVQQTSAVPYIQTWSTTIQYEPLSKTLIQITYQGLKATHLYGGFNLAQNTAPLSALIAAVQGNKNLGITSNNTYSLRNNNNDPNASILQETAFQKLEPYQNFFNQALPEVYPRRGVANYNGLYLSINQRLTRNLSFLSNYVWSKSLDNVPANSGFSGGFGVAPPQNPFDMASEYSVSAYDQPSRFRAGYSYKLPFGIGQEFRTKNGLLDRIIGNISTSGIAMAASGLPNTVTLGTTGYFTSITPSGTDSCVATGANHFCTSGGLASNSGYTLRPDIVPGVPLINKGWKRNPFNSAGVGGISPYLNAAAFAVPGSPGNPRLGNAPRTLGNARSPREFTFDMQLAKGITIRKSYRLNISANFNNVFNHPIYYGVANHAITSAMAVNTVTGTYNSPTIPSNFGNLNGGNSGGMSRVIRFGAEFNF